MVLSLIPTLEPRRWEQYHIPSLRATAGGPDRFPKSDYLISERFTRRLQGGQRFRSSDRGEKNAATYDDAQRRSAVRAEGLQTEGCRVGRPRGEGWLRRRKCRMINSRVIKQVWEEREWIQSRSVLLNWGENSEETSQEKQRALATHIFHFFPPVARIGNTWQGPTTVTANRCDYCLIEKSK